MQLLPLLLTGALAPLAAAQQVRFEGRVIAFDGTPVAGAAIGCAAPDDLDTTRLLADPQVTTDEHGRFTIAVIEPAETAASPPALHVAAAGQAAVKRSLSWDDPQLGDIVLTRGQRLFGRVRDVDGKPLAEARVIATDLLEHGNALRSGTTHGFFCSARSRASGIFELPCALDRGVRLEFQADGYESAWLEPVSAGTPLEVNMKKTGWLQGRVLDPDGRGVGGARVFVAYELRSTVRHHLTAEDGSFRVPLQRDARWRLTASRRSDGETLEGRTDVMTGARENLEIIVRSTRPSSAGGALTVRAVAGGNREAVADFRAVALWEKYANTNTSYREYRFRMLFKNAGQSKDGSVEVAAPGENAPTTGAVRVIADGFAPATVTEVEWAEPEEGEERDPVVVELEPEATVAGVVRDVGTGKPIANARVRARPKPRPNEGEYADNGDEGDVATADDGSFVLRGLGEGRWRLTVQHDGHPTAPSVDIELGAAEQRTQIELKMPTGARVAGQLEGIGVGGGARVFLAPLPKQVFGDTSGSFFTSTMRGQAHEGIAVEPDGRFAFSGIALDNHLLVVRLPSEPRLGGDLFLPIEPFRVRQAGIDRKFDCSEDQPGIIRGKISFSHARTEYSNLVVVAQPVVNEKQHFFAAYNQRYPGPRSFVERDGGYEIRVGPGDYRLFVVDLVTAVAVHTTDKKIVVATGGTAERDLEIALARVVLTRKAAADVEQPAAFDRVEVRFVAQAAAKAGQNFFGNEQYDSRMGVHWPAEREQLSIVLPEGAATLLCRNEIGLLRVDNRRWQNAPLGRAEVEIELGDEIAVECAIEAAPEIPPGDDNAEKNNDADALDEIQEIVRDRGP